MPFKLAGCFWGAACDRLKLITAWVRRHCLHAPLLEHIISYRCWRPYVTQVALLFLLAACAATYGIDARQQGASNSQHSKRSSCTAVVILQLPEASAAPRLVQAGRPAVSNSICCINILQASIIVILNLHARRNSHFPKSAALRAHGWVSCAV